MEQLTNEEKAKIFAMYLGCKVNDGTSVTETLMGVGYLFNEYHALYAPKCSAAYPIERCKLLLKSLEDITDEDIKGLITTTWQLPDDIKKFVNGLELVYVDDEGASYQHIHFNNLTAKQHQFLMSGGYAVPIYPYNLNPIELGIAINVSSTPNQRG